MKLAPRKKVTIIKETPDPNIPAGTGRSIGTPSTDGQITVLRKNDGNMIHTILPAGQLERKTGVWSYKSTRRYEIFRTRFWWVFGSVGYMLKELYRCLLTAQTYQLKMELCPHRLNNKQQDFCTSLGTQLGHLNKAPCFFF